MNVVNGILALGIDPLYAFLTLVGVDILFGLAYALKTKTFDGNKLPSFLRSQLGTVEFLVVAGSAYTAYVTGGDLKSAATAVVVGGGGALSVSLIKDIFVKIQEILASGAKK